MKARITKVFQRLRGHRGSLDGFNGTALNGWVAPGTAYDGPVEVGVYTAQGLIAQGTASLFRPDLKTMGIGTGYHGFSIALDAVNRQTIGRAGGQVWLRTLRAPVFTIGHYRFSAEELGSIPDDASQAEPKTKPADMGQYLYGALEQMEGLLARAADMPAVLAAPRLSRHAALFDRTDHLGRIEAAGTGEGTGQGAGDPLPEPITAYAEYVRYRYKLDPQFPLRDEADAAAHFAKWYLAGYSTLRSGLRVPISAAMLEWFNTPVVIPGTRAHLTRATWAFLTDVPPILQRMDFNNPDWVAWAVYWWSINHARAVFCEDCLVPPAYVAILSAVPDAWAGKPHAPSEFMIRFQREAPALAALDLGTTTGRRDLALAILALAAQRPDYLRYVPADTVAELLAPDDSARGCALGAFVARHSDGRIRGITREGYARALRLHGFDLQAMAFASFTPEGHRVEAAMLPAVDSPDIVDLQLIGPFEKASGLGQATRLSARVLEETEFSVNCVNFGLDNPAPEGFSQVGALSGYKRAKVNLIHLNAESIPLVFAYQPDAFSGAYNIGYFFWELDTPAACHHLGIAMLDEIWVSTEYGVRIFARPGGAPVHNVGMCIEELPPVPRDAARGFLRDRFGFADDVFVFLVTFDSFSFVQRKNPVGTLRAFRAAFDGVADVRLVIKTQNRRKIADPVQQKIWAQVDALMDGDDRIVILDETLDYADLLRLKAGCDAYVSLHKSEGWGFGMIEAMNLGVPVVATAYSGNMDFCSPETAFLVDAPEVELGPDDYIFVRPGQKWAEPDHDSAVRALRAVHGDAEARAARAAAARRNVQDNFTARPIAQRYAARLAEILKEL